MSIKNQYNLKSPGVKRLMREAAELAEPTEEYYACPLDDNLFEWHFTVRGPPSTEFEGGCYHGRILLPSQYPMQPPNIILLTPNGRFEINKKICLSISGHHPESWQPSWSIRTALLALIAFMPTPSAGTIGSLDYSKEERQVLAKKSKNWECSVCGKVSTKLLEASTGLGPTLSHEETSLLEQISLKAEEETKNKQPAQIETEQTEIIEEVGEVITAVHLRQRVATDDGGIEVHTTNDVLLEESVNRSSKDQMWTAVIWLLVSLITLLIIRRLFFI